MLDRVDDWGAYLSSAGKRNEEISIKKNPQTGRPLGNADFIRNLEFLTGKELAPKRPGRKSASPK